ncbi:protein krasavietz [Folsomia candida]|uniref:Protein krasavietz n=1 Tax=Folsomia candida TaxID=158441 RepID=A0A226DEV5_FOLCA|nr:protein krasavietz [Folsomia candida]OXA43723.1 Protein krasavietz [Folsomia candida]
MSQKTEKPVLSGQRIKTRKRDEKEKLDVNGFRDQLLQGLIEAGTDLEALSKFLDGAGGTKLDYRRYGETLFDVLIAGGILGPNGVTPAEGDKLAPASVFATENTIDALRLQEQVFLKLTRRFKYLEKLFQEQIKKVFTYMKRYSDEDRIKLARMTALWICNGSLPPTCLALVGQEHLVKDNVALDFILEVFTTWKQEKGVSNVVSGLKKSGLESKMMEFFPSNKRTPEYFNSVFQERNLAEIVRLQKNQASQEMKLNLHKVVSDALDEGKAAKDIIAEVKDYSTKNNLPEHEIVTIVWGTLMAAVEWNKKEELVAEQALKHIKNYASFLGAFSTTPKAELTLILRIQEFCYDNMNFMKVFQKIILLLYKNDVLSEDSIMKWYKEAHSSKGKSVFLEQMKKFIEWLQSAEEESESDSD